jgi:hypothetical protein
MICDGEQHQTRLGSTRVTKRNRHSSTCLIHTEPHLIHILSAQARWSSTSTTIWRRPTGRWRPLARAARGRVRDGLHVRLASRGNYPLKVRQFRDVSPTEVWLHLDADTTKNTEARVVPLGSWCVLLIAMLREVVKGKQPDDLIFTRGLNHRPSAALRQAVEARLPHGGSEREPYGARPAADGGWTPG